MSETCISEFFQGTLTHPDAVHVAWQVCSFYWTEMGVVFLLNTPQHDYPDIQVPELPLCSFSPPDIPPKPPFP